MKPVFDVLEYNFDDMFNGVENWARSYKSNSMVRYGLTTILTL